MAGRVKLECTASMSYSAGQQINIDHPRLLSRIGQVGAIAKNTAPAPTACNLLLTRLITTRSAKSVLSNTAPASTVRNLLFPRPLATQSAKSVLSNTAPASTVRKLLALVVAFVVALVVASVVAHQAYHNTIGQVGAIKHSAGAPGRRTIRKISGCIRPFTCFPYQLLPTLLSCTSPRRLPARLTAIILFRLSVFNCTPKQRVC